MLKTTAPVQRLSAGRARGVCPRRSFGRCNVVTYASAGPPQNDAAQGSVTAAAEPSTSTSHTNKFNWTFKSQADALREDGRLVMDLPVAAIRRPLGRTRANNQEKVAALMESIQQIGLQEPIDVLEVDGVYYGFSGCHRFEAHQRLGSETIRCRVRKATREVLKMHMM